MAKQKTEVPQIDLPNPEALPTSDELIGSPPASDSAGLFATSNSAFKVVKASERPRAGQRVLLYGPPKVGKSTAASFSPRPVFIEVEAGIDNIDVDRVPVKSFEDAVVAVRELTKMDQYQTIVVDSATKLEEFAVDYVVRTKQIGNSRRAASSIEDYGYGKGYTFLAEAWKMFLFSLHDAVLSGKDVILIAHDATEMVRSSLGEDFRAMQPRLNKAILYRTLDECDSIVLLAQESEVRDGKQVGLARLFYLSPIPGGVAGTRRRNLPAILPAKDAGKALWPLILSAKD